MATDDAINHGSNISGISLLLNMEKISDSVDIADMERKVKNMYIDAADDDVSEDEKNEEDILEEYEQAIEELESQAAEGDNTGSNNGDEDDDGDGGGDQHDTLSVISKYSNKPSFIQDNKDGFYMQKTRDEHLQHSINRVMENVPKMNIDMEQEIEDERRNTLLEQIESLRDDLSELGVTIDGPQYYVAYDASLKRIEEIHRRLTFKYNKLKYNSIAEEALVAGASLLEMIFNGKHEYFGCRPDITGYSDVVKSKLKRIRVETSTAVSRFVVKNQVGVMPRLMMELLPSLITQSQRRKLQAGDSLNATHLKKGSIRSHISDLNNMLPG